MKAHKHCKHYFEQESLLKQKDDEIAQLKKRLCYYENSNSPPSSNSLFWKRQKKERKRMVNSCSDTRPGRKAGHKGISHQFKSSQTVEHTVDCCQCGSRDLRFFSQQQRIIVDITKPQPYTVTLHRINHYLCTACDMVIKPAVDIPEHGMLGKNLLGITTTLWSQCRLPSRRISDVFEILYGLKISSVCINNSLVNVSESLQKFAGDVKKELQVQAVPLLMRHRCP